jgi:hypothetical protein
LRTRVRAPAVSRLDADAGVAEPVAVAVDVETPGRASRGVEPGVGVASASTAASLDSGTDGVDRSVLPSQPASDASTARREGDCTTGGTGSSAGNATSSVAPTVVESVGSSPERASGAGSARRRPRVVVRASPHAFVSTAFSSGA